MNNSFPFVKSGIVEPIATQPVIKENELYKDTKFIRDERLQKAFKVDELNRNTSYKPVIDVETKFRYPENSHDLLQYKKYKEFTKNELKDKYIHDIYNEMSDTVINNVSSDEIHRIQGIYYDDKSNNISSTVASKPPVYSSYDATTNKYLFNNILLDTKYQPYDGNFTHAYK